MKKLLIALAAGAMALTGTAAAAEQPQHRDNHRTWQQERHHRDYQRNHRHHRRHNNDTVRFGIYVNPYGYYSSPGYYNYGPGYYGPTWPAGQYIGCTRYGRNGLLVDKYGVLVRSYEYYTRANVYCDTRY